MSQTGLPNVTINFANGLIGSTTPMNDGVTGLIASATAVGTFVLGQAYLVTCPDDVSALGITAVENPAINKAVNDFYTEAALGTLLWIIGVAPSVTMEDMLNVQNAYATTLILSAKGAISILMVAKSEPAGYTPVILDGLDSDVYAAMLNAQALGNWATTQQYAPLFAILPGRRYTGTPSDLRDLTQGANNRVVILLADNVSGSNDACVGQLAGRISSIPVQRSVARVKTGAIAANNMYIGSVAAENGNPDIINGLGFITARTFVGKAGYFWTDDKLATSPTDDYALIPRRRVIDKAYRIAYQTTVNELSDEIPVTDAGCIPASAVKDLENTISVAIETQMTAVGNLGVDTSNPNDTGVQVYIDPTQDIVTTNSWLAKLRVKPYGYAKYIDVNLGFSTATNN